MLRRFSDRQFMPRIRTDILLFCAAGIVLALYLSPLVILGEDSHILIHDNLDSNVTWYRVLVESGQVFSPLDSTIPTVMGDITRNVYPSDLKLFTWLYMLLPPFQAYAVSQVLLHLLAFLGMYLLLRRHFLREDKDRPIAIGCSLAFALLPFWPFGGLSVAGQPLALYAFLSVRNRSSSWKDWLIILVVPFFSSLVLAFAFFLAAMGLLWLYDAVVRRKTNIVFLLSIFAMGLVFVLVEYRLVYLMFFDDSFESIRSAWPVTGHGLGTVLAATRDNFRFGQYHAHSLQYPFILVSIVITLLVILYRKSLSTDRLLLVLLVTTGAMYLYAPGLRHPVILLALMVVPLLVMLYKRSFSTDRLLLVLLAITGAVSLWYGFWSWQGWIPLKESIGVIRTFQSRFFFLHPLLWYLVFALALRKIGEGISWGKGVVLVLILAQCFLCFSSTYAPPLRPSWGPTYEQFYCNWRAVWSPFCRERELATYAQFFSVPLFNEIRDYIGGDQDSYRVASIGLHPSVSQYNGFYTVDGYFPNYPLEYKIRFREIIAKELDRHPANAEYFDNSGIRAYILVAELPRDFLITKDNKYVIDNLELNMDAFRQMGGRYIFSTVPINNAGDNDLILEREFTHPKSVWRIYLYRVQPEAQDYDPVSTGIRGCHTDLPPPIAVPCVLLTDQ